MRKVKKELEELAESQSKQVNVVWPYESSPNLKSIHLAQRQNSRFSPAVNSISMMPIWLLPCWMDPRWVTGLRGRLDIFTPIKSPEQKIIGIRTDFRRAGESEGAVVNPMIEGACDWLVRTREELMETVFQFF